MFDKLKKWYEDRFVAKYIVYYRFPSRWYPGKVVEGKERPSSRHNALQRARIGNGLYGDGSHWVRKVEDEPSN